MSELKITPLQQTIDGLIFSQIQFHASGLVGGRITLWLDKITMIFNSSGNLLEINLKEKNVS